MTRLLGGLLILALAWSGWWWFAANGLERSLSVWLEQRRAIGWQADVRTIETDGFPLKIAALLEAPALADPQTGVAVQASRLRVEAPVYWPGYATLIFPTDAIVVATPLGRWRLVASGAQADLRLRPGAALEVERMALTSGPWAVSDTDGETLRADGLNVTAQQIAEAQFDLSVLAPSLRPGAAVRDRLRVPEDWPLTFDAFALDMEVTFDRPWDRRAIEERRPQPRQIVIRTASAEWGELQIRAAANLDVDEDGIPTGTLSLQARNWRDMLTLAETAGVLSEGLRAQAERGFATLAGLTGNPDAIDVQLNFAGGLVAVGFIPIGPAPQLILR